MQPAEATNLRDKVTPDLSKTSEDYLDWMENQQRSSEDIRRVDGAFIGSWLGVSALWLILGSGTVGGALAVGATAFFPQLLGR